MILNKTYGDDKQMPFVADFDTPKSASGRYISVVGTVPASTSFVEVMQVSVCRYNSSTEYFYLTKQYNNAATTPSVISESLVIAVVPMISTSDVASLTAFGALVGQVDLKEN